MIDPSERTNSKSHLCQGGNENIPSPHPSQSPQGLLLEPITTSTPSSSPAPLQRMTELLCFHKEMEKHQRKTDSVVFSYSRRALQIRTALLLLSQVRLPALQRLSASHSYQWQCLLWQLLFQELLIQTQVSPGWLSQWNQWKWHQL